MLDFTDYQVLISKITYRPGWRLTVWLDPNVGPYLYVKAKVYDSYNEGKTTELRIVSLIPPCNTTGDFFRWLAWRMKQIEIHESMEWLKYDDKMLNDPHKDLDPTPEMEENVWNRQQVRRGLRNQVGER